MKDILEKIIKNGTIEELWNEAIKDNSISQVQEHQLRHIKPLPAKKCFLNEDGCFWVYWVTSAQTGEVLLQVVWRIPGYSYIAHIGEKDGSPILWNIEVYNHLCGGGQNYPMASTGYIKQPQRSLLEEFKSTRAEENIH